MFNINDIFNYHVVLKRSKNVLSNYLGRIIDNKTANEISEKLAKEKAYLVRRCLLDRYIGLLLDQKLMKEISFLYAGNKRAILNKGIKINKCSKEDTAFGIIDNIVTSYKGITAIQTTIISGVHAGDSISIVSTSQNPYRLCRFVAYNLGLSLTNRGKNRYSKIDDLKGILFKAKIIPSDYNEGRCGIHSFLKSSTCKTFNESPLSKQGR